MIYKLLPNTDKILHTPTQPFDFSNPPCDPIQLIEDLKDTMQEYNGIGLSANQVDMPFNNLSVCVIGNPSDRKSIIGLFNPKIVDTFGDKTYMVEGCLSYPGLTFKVKRFENIRVRFSNEKGETNTTIFRGITSRIIQHECDHLNGKTFIYAGTKFHVDQAYRKLKYINRHKKLFK